MNRNDQRLIALCIYGITSLLFLCAASVAWYGAFQPNTAPGLIAVAGLFTLLGALAAIAVCACSVNTRA